MGSNPPGRERGRRELRHEAEAAQSVPENNRPFEVAEAKVPREGEAGDWSWRGQRRSGQGGAFRATLGSLPLRPESFT